MALVTLYLGLEGLSACSLDFTTSRGRIEAHEITPAGGNKKEQEYEFVSVVEEDEVKRKISN